MPRDVFTWFHRLFFYLPGFGSRREEREKRGERRERERGGGGGGRKRRRGERRRRERREREREERERAYLALCFLKISALHARRRPCYACCGWLNGSLLAFAYATWFPRPAGNCRVATTGGSTVFYARRTPPPSTPLPSVRGLVRYGTVWRYVPWFAGAFCCVTSTGIF